jgi:hypothetical protein
MPATDFCNKIGTSQTVRRLVGNDRYWGLGRHGRKQPLRQPLTDGVEKGLVIVGEL